MSDKNDTAVRNHTHVFHQNRWARWLEDPPLSLKTRKKPTLVGVPLGERGEQLLVQERERFKGRIKAKEGQAPVN